MGAVYEAAAGAAAEAHVAGSGYKAIAAALGPTMRTLSPSTGLGFVHFGEKKSHSFCQPSPSYCPFLQNKMTGLLVPFESLDTHSNKNLASISFSARALNDRPIRL
jgi:hypothetical protein